MELHHYTESKGLDFHLIYINSNSHSCEDYNDRNGLDMLYEWNCRSNTLCDRNYPYKHTVSDCWQQTRFFKKLKNSFRLFGTFGWRGNCSWTSAAEERKRLKLINFISKVDFESYNFLKISTKLKRRINSIAIEYVIWLNKFSCFYCWCEKILWNKTLNILRFIILKKRNSCEKNKINWKEKKRRRIKIRRKECNIRIKLN